MGNWLNSKSPTHIVALLFSVATLGFMSQNASALTAAGTTISNTASVGYSVGGVSQTAIPSSPSGNSSTSGGSGTSFVVDRKVAFSVTGGAVVGVQPGQVGIPTGATSTSPNTAMMFTVINLGNAAQSFSLSTASVSGDTFAPGSFTMYLGTSSTFNPAAPGTAVTSITNLLAGSSQIVWVVANMPTGTYANGNQALVTLQAQATVPNSTGTNAVAPLVIAGLTPGANEANTVVAAGGNSTGGANVSTVDVVLAEVDNNAVAAVTSPSVSAMPGLAAAAPNGSLTNAPDNGIVIATGVYKIQSAALIITKLASPVCDPVNGNTNPMNIPGAVIQWAVTIHNPTVDGNNIPVTTNATLTTTTDPLDVSTAFDPNKVAGKAAGSTGTLCSGTGSVNLPASQQIAGLGYTLSSTAPAAGASPTTAAPAGSISVAAATVGNNGTVNIVVTNILTAGMAASSGLTTTNTRVNAGDLLPGEYLTLYFNSIVQ